jgi:sulfur-oxidizing protein SoxY
MNRRLFLATSALAATTAALRAGAQQKFQPAQDITPLVNDLTHGVKAQQGGIDIELPQIAENGNSVPLRLKVQSPMTPEDHVAALYVIAERNPRPLVATFHLGPDAGRAEISTRIRLAGTQKLTVLAELSGGRFLVNQADVLVTSAACMDDSL